MNWIVEAALQETGYPFGSIDDDEIPIRTRWSGPELGRCLSFMLFDQLGGVVLRGSLTRSRTGFMFGREFFLGLPLTTEPSFRFRIMAEQAFAGISGGPWTLDQAAIGNIEQTIGTSVAMYESTIDGFATMADVEEFIELARQCFGASGH